MDSQEPWIKLSISKLSVVKLSQSFTSMCLKRSALNVAQSVQRPVAALTTTMVLSREDTRTTSTRLNPSLRCTNTSERYAKLTVAKKLTIFTKNLAPQSSLKCAGWSGPLALERLSQDKTSAIELTWSLSTTLTGFVRTLNCKTREKKFRLKSSLISSLTVLALEFCSKTSPRLNSKLSTLSKTQLLLPTFSD